MKTTRLITVAALLFIGCLPVCAQVRISNVWAEVQDRNIAVHYTLASKQPVDVTLQYSFDYGLTWLDCKSVTGHLTTQTTGNKTIIWDCRKDGYEKGNVLFNVIANEQPTQLSQSSQSSQSTLSDNYKKNIFGLDLGFGARKMNEWGTFLDIGIRYTFNFSPHIGWDVANLKYQELLAAFSQGLLVAFSFDNCLIQATTGIRAYTKTFTKDMKGYGSLKAGYGYQPYLEAGGFAYELEIGAHITRTFFMGVVFNSQNLRGEWESLDFNLNCAYTGLRIGFNF